MKLYSEYIVGVALNHDIAGEHANQRENEPQSIAASDEQPHLKSAKLLVSTIQEEGQEVDACAMEHDIEKNETHYSQCSCVYWKIIGHAVQENTTRDQKGPAITHIYKEAETLNVGIGRIVQTISTPHTCPIFQRE